MDDPSSWQQVVARRLPLPAPDKKQFDLGRAVSRILSSPKPFGGENHLSWQPVPGTLPPESGVGAGNSVVPYLALHPMGFSVPPRLRLERWALTPPFHPYPRFFRNTGGLFSVALSVGTPRGIASRVYPPASRSRRGGIGPRGYAASRPLVFGLSSPIPPLRDGSDSPPFQNHAEYTQPTA
jgi:hypothetical protein